MSDEDYEFNALLRLAGLLIVFGGGALLMLGAIGVVVWRLTK